MRAPVSTLVNTLATQPRSPIASPGEAVDHQVVGSGLLERADELAALGAAARAAARSTGTVMLVHGEAGIGKSAVVGALRSRLPAEARLLVGWCDALSTPRTLGPLKDVAPALGGALAASLASSDREGVMSALHAALQDGPVTALVIEDVHWADEATLDVLRFLGRRAPVMPVILVLTYRDDELDRDHPLTRLLGDLGHGDALTRLPLRRLSPQAVAQLAAGAALDAATVHELTDGNPYLVTELIASASGTSVPPTVVDGVLGRLRRLPVAVQDVVEQLAVVPGPVRRGVADEIVPGGWSLLGAAEEKGLMVVRGGTVSFRHELTRRAVLDALPGSRRTELEHTALVALEHLDGADLSQLVHHAVACGKEEAILRHGPAAAREASASGAHRESARHYATVLAHEHRLALAERADLWDAYAIELYTVALGTRIVAAGERAVELRRSLGEPKALIRSLRWLSRFCWYAGERRRAEVAAAEARTVAETAGDEGLLALALSNESQLAMLADDHARAVPLAERAIEIARRRGDAMVLSHALNNLGTAYFRHGADGSPALRESIAVALAADDHENACRGYVNIGWSLLDRYELDLAEPLVAEGLEHARKAEFLAFWQYLQSVWAKVQLARAHWAEATATLDALSPDAPPSWCVALGVRACIDARTGAGDPAPAIREGWQLARQLGEAQRTAPMAAAALEAAALTRTEPLLDGLAVYQQVRREGEGTTAAEIAFRLRVLGTEVPDHDELIADLGQDPYGLMLQGRWREAAVVWRRFGWPYHEAEALAASDDPDDNLAALDRLDRLGAVPLAQQVRRRLRGLGAAPVPRGPAGETRTDPAGLTGRQQVVMTLLVDGLTNAAIADRLTVSVRTVDSHVAAILAKLGAKSRYDAVARYAALGMPHPRADLGSASVRSP